MMIDNDDDLNETKRYYKDQEEETGEPGSKLSSPKAVNTGPAAGTGECRKSNRFQARRPIQKHPVDQTQSHQGQGSQQ